MATKARYQAEREDSKELTELKIRTRVPSKWRLVDLETGDVWRWASPQERAQLMLLSNLVRATDIAYEEKVSG